MITHKLKCQHPTHCDAFGLPVFDNASVVLYLGNSVEHPVNWRFRTIFPLCATEIIKIIATWCAAAKPFRCAVYRFYRTVTAVWQIEPRTRNPYHRAWLFSQSFASQASPHAISPVLALALSASHRLLTEYSSSHLVRPVSRRLYAEEACSASEPASLSPILNKGAEGACSSWMLIWMLHASASWFKWCLCDEGEGLWTPRGRESPF